MMKPKIQVETCINFTIQQLDPATEALLIDQIAESLQSVIASSC